jgi:HEAT repeat protein
MSLQSARSRTRDRVLDKLDELDGPPPSATAIPRGPTMKAILTVLLALPLAGCALGTADDPPAPAEKKAERRVKTIRGDDAPKPAAGAEQPLSDLIAALKDPKVTKRRQAAAMIGGRGAKAAPAVPALTAAVKDDPEPAMRSQAAEALGGIGLQAKAAVPTLLNALNDKDALVRETAAEALADIGVEAKTVVPALVKLLGDTDMNVRCAAANSLADFGSAAQSAIPELKKALKDKHPFVREAAAEAIKAIDRAGRRIGS